MKHRMLTLSIAIGMTLFSGCKSGDTTSKQLSIIPLPKEMKVHGGEFRLSDDTKIIFSPNDKEIKSVAGYLANLIAPATGFNLPLLSGSEPTKNAIFLNINEGITGQKGVYHLAVTNNTITIEAPESIGLFYGVQSLRQLLPPEIESQSVQSDIRWVIPAVTIKDEPQFQYRGLHLDVCRHFFPVSFIKKYIDLLALHKMNKFHWHLTDDQGWRLEIKKYPKLQEVASQRKETLIGHGGKKPFKFDGKPYGGYYTQEEAREIVEYAAQRYITVIPEIEMPGHATAALAAYPHVGCTEGPYEVITRWGVFPDIYCAGKEATFEFLENVLLEVIDIFPSQYIHIGGDEAPKDRWKKCPLCQARIRKENLKNEHELQSYFIGRIEKFLNKHGRQIIGWDEILEGGLAPGATVMSWRGETGGIQAAKMNHDVIMTPNSHLYFDFYQTDPKNEPLAIGGYLPLEKVYSYHPVPKELTPTEAKHILGAQGNLWTEYVKTQEHAEYMVFPRAAALAEVVWTPQEKRNYSDFRRRLENHFKRLDVLDVNYFYEVPKPMANTNKAGFLDSTEIVLSAPIPDTEVRYTLDGSTPSKESSLYIQPIHVTNTGVIKAITVKNETGETSSVLEIPVKKVQYIPAADKITPAKQGLSYAYYKGFFHSVKQLHETKPQTKGVVSDQQFIPDIAKNEPFGMIFTGYLPIKEEGIYHFFLTSDDGSILYLNGEELINNDGLHAAQTVDEPVALKAGYHAISLLFTEGGGGFKLDLKAKFPDGSIKELNPSQFVVNQ
ncbi:family 20 glycosylhydrolase [Thermophagus sp. OGC60D27]|uniref:family 20 glycosylhydrolase n=1 Tax=Thermophagus sp. OGC60D27 TaxID=3458415 RepID=UPI0040380ED4